MGHMHLKFMWLDDEGIGSIVSYMDGDIEFEVLTFTYLDCVLFFFFKQKTAYEMRISDWSSDVCSSDLSGSAMTWSRVSGCADCAWTVPMETAASGSRARQASRWRIVWIPLEKSCEA